MNCCDGDCNQGRDCPIRKTAVNCNGACNQGRRLCPTPTLCAWGDPWRVKGDPQPLQDEYTDTEEVAINFARFMALVIACLVAVFIIATCTAP